MTLRDVPTAPVTAEEQQVFASARLATFEVPRLWEFRDSLPKTPTQRVKNYELRDGAWRPLPG